MYVVTDQSDIRVYAHGREKKPLATVEIGERTRPGHVLADRTFYVTTDATLYAVRGKK